MIKMSLRLSQLPLLRNGRKPMKLGYVSTDLSECDLRSQIQHSVADIDTFFVDKIGRRDSFRKLMAGTRPGDCIVVIDIGQLADSMLDLRLTLINLDRQRVRLTSVSDRLEAVSPSDLLPAYHAIHNFKAQLSDRGNNAGLLAARAQGRLGGRKPVLTTEKKATLDELLTQSDDFRSHASAVGVSVRTVRRYAAGEYAH